MQLIPLPPTNLLNPDGTITPIQEITPTGLETPLPPVNPPFVPTPPIDIPTFTTSSQPPPQEPEQPKRSPAVPVSSSAILVQPYVDPIGTTRIYKTEDAYQILPINLNTYTYNYAIGTAAALTTKTFTVVNLCTQNALGVTLNRPQFLDASIGDTFLLPPLESQLIDLTVNETASINLIMERKLVYAEPIIVTVEVLNVNGPVYVQTPGFVPPPPFPIEGGSEIINTTSGPVLIPPDLPPKQRNLLLSQSLAGTLRPNNPLLAI